MADSISRRNFVNACHKRDIDEKISVVKTGDLFEFKLAPHSGRGISFFPSIQ